MHLADLTRDRRQTDRATLFVLDLDNFKIVNDTAGHPTGDRYLAAVASRLVSELRAEDLFARLGGDEFAAVVHEASPEKAVEVGERLLRAAAGFRFHEGDHVFDLTISMGICPIQPGDDPHQVVARTDQALYRAKRTGRNRLAVASRDRSDLVDVTRTKRWATRVKDALVANELVVCLQPIVDLGTGVVGHHEALVRLPGPGGRLVLPAEFLPTAERFGLMPAIDRAVLTRVLQQLRVEPGLRVFANLNAASFEDDALLEFVRREVVDARLEPGRLGIEITESTALRDRVRSTARIEALRELGCLVALDDFGVGFTSFAELFELPVDLVKIGAPFTTDALSDRSHGRVVIRGLVDVAHGLGKRVVAEHVESPVTADLLRELGVELAQGYLFGAPVPIDESVASLEQRRRLRAAAASADESAA